jgi:TolB protein
LLVVIFGGASGCSDHPVTPSPSEPDDRIIAFSSDSGASRGFSIFVMHADGSHTARLTDGGGAFDSFPTWSHDGQMITFDSDRSGGAATAWAMNADGSDVHFLADGYGARWSPDGTKLIYTGKASDNNWVVYIANADGSSPVRLTTNPRGEVRPAWSPDGAHLVYSAYPAEDMNLYVVNADGTGERQLTHTTGFSEDAMWSPDGTRIAFAHGLPNELAAVHVINIDGTNDQTLTALGCDKPSWSPDSRQIAYQCTIGQPPRLYRMNADGSAKRVLTTSGVFSVGPSWKPVP